jgi:glycosyltransferase involved in cell wall biosynthesis
VNVLLLRPKLEIGGAAEYLIEVGEGLARRGHRVVVASGGGVQCERARSFAERTYERLPLAPYLGPRRLPNGPGLVASAAWVAAIVKAHQIDLINTHHRFASLVGKAASRAMRVPLVSTMHEIRRDSAKLTALSLGQRVVTLSAFVKRHVTETYGVDESAVSVIPMGIPIPSPRDGSRRKGLLAELHLDEGDTLVGCVARLVGRKGHRFLLEALADAIREHPRVRLILVGDGPERSKLEAAVGRLGIASAVRFLGTRDDLDDLYGLVDFTVLPSLQEEFGVVLLESLALGKPVVATSVGGIPEIVTEETGVLVPPADPGALAAAIGALAANPGSTAALGSNGRRLVSERYSTDALVDRTEALFESVTEGARPGARRRVS